jgi:NADPH:quinone reductase-like Zn-dependent oxidoreductase
MTIAPLPASMSAWVCPRYGGPDVLRLEERPVPRPAAGEVLIRIRATTVSSGDARIRALRVPPGMGLAARLALGLTGPRRAVLGTECAGDVVAAGAGVTALRPGDAVFAFPGVKVGCHAEYRVMPVSGGIALKPANLTHSEAAGLSFGGSTALHFLNAAGVGRGTALLVIGASGAVGSAMVQMAKHRGARVTGVTSTANLALVRDLGADAVIDYTTGDWNGGARYDVIADTVAARSFVACLDALNENGRYLSLAGGIGDMLARPRGSKRSIAGPAAERAEYVAEIAALAASGALRPVIDRTFAFADLPAAHAHVDTGRKRGTAVVTLGPEAG